MEIVIIGCGTAGGTAAQFARKKNRKARSKFIAQRKDENHSFEGTLDIG